MFLASILFCFVSFDQIRGIKAEDAKGPYETHQECIDRAIEMSHYIKSVNPSVVVRGYRCDIGEST